MMRTLVVPLGAVLLGAQTLGGCGASGEAAAPPTTTMTTTAASPAPPVTFAVGAVSLTVQPTAAFTSAGGTLSVATDADGSARLHVTSSATRRQAAATLAATPSGPDGTTLGVLADGSALVRTGDGTLAAGITPTKARLADDDGTVTLSASSGGELWLSDTAVASLDWGEREGGRSLAVTPTAWGRSGSQAAGDMVWSAVAAQPEADTPSMRDQLDCHRFGAPDKATWNLEPWRPQVDSITLLSARCNPT